MKRKEEELPIIRAYYEFLVWFVPKIARFPRDQRFTLGERMEKSLFLGLELLIRARYASQKLELLDQLNVELEVVRFQIRLAKDLKCLPVKAYGDASEKLVALGKQLGGWMKQQSKRMDKS